MHFHSVSESLLILLALNMMVAAAPGWSNAALYAPKPSPQTSCYTAMLERPLKKPETMWSTWKTSCTVLTTVATTTLTIPSTSSITATSTVTVTATGAGQTHTHTTTLGSMTVVTATVTELHESISATTWTTTISATSGALIEDTVQEVFVQTPVKKKRNPVLGLGVDPDVDLLDRKIPRLSDSRRTLPGDVICYKHQGKCSTSRVTHTATTTATTSTTVTVTTTETTTTNPGATTTTTVPTTSLVTLTKTVTSTKVTFNFLTVATATFWESCARPNIASAIDHIPIIDGELSPNMRRLSSEAGKTSAYDCCVAAHMNPRSGVWAWEPAATKCHIFESDTCVEGKKSERANTPIVSFTQGQPKYLMGNANCAKWTELKYERAPI